MNKLNLNKVTWGRCSSTEAYDNNRALLGEHGDDDDLDDLEKDLEPLNRMIAAHRASFQPFLPGAENWGLEK